MTTPSTPVIDPWARAMNPPPPMPAEIFGQCVVNVWLCALVKGQGKVPYEAGTLDPNTGKETRPLTAIEIAVHKLDEKADEQPAYRQYIAEFGEWPEIVLPNLHEIGLTDLKTLHNAWVQVTFVQTGQTYTNKNGEEKNSTTFKFMKIFKDEAECRSASKAGDSAQPATQPAVAPSSNGSKERETALKFLVPYIRNAIRAGGGDLEKIRAGLAPQLAGQALLAKYFTIDSEEVVDLIAQELSK